MKMKERSHLPQLRPGAVKYINFFLTFLKAGNYIAHFLTVYIDIKTIQASREWLLWKSKIRKGGYDPRRGTQASKVPAGFCFSNLCGSYTDVHFILMTEHIHIGLLFFCMNEILHNKNFNYKEKSSQLCITLLRNKMKIQNVHSI